MAVNERAPGVWFFDDPPVLEMSNANYPGIVDWTTVDLSSIGIPSNATFLIARFWRLRTDFGSIGVRIPGTTYTHTVGIYTCFTHRYVPVVNSQIEIKSTAGGIYGGYPYMAVMGYFTSDTATMFSDHVEYQMTNISFQTFDFSGIVSQDAVFLITDFFVIGGAGRGYIRPVGSTREDWQPAGTPSSLMDYVIPLGSNKTVEVGRDHVSSDIFVIPKGYINKGVAEVNPALLPLPSATDTYEKITPTYSTSAPPNAVSLFNISPDLDGVYYNIRNTDQVNFTTTRRRSSWSTAVVALDQNKEFDLSLSRIDVPFDYYSYGFIGANVVDLGSGSTLARCSQDSELRKAYKEFSALRSFNDVVYQLNIDYGAFSIISDPEEIKITSGAFAVYPSIKHTNIKAFDTTLFVDRTNVPPKDQHKYTAYDIVEQYKPPYGVRTVPLDWSVNPPDDEVNTPVRNDNNIVPTPGFEYGHNTGGAVWGGPGNPEVETWEMPFPVLFFGKYYDQIYVDVNGNIWFDEPTSQYGFDLATIKRPVICAWNNHLTTNYNGRFTLSKSPYDPNDPYIVPDKIIVDWVVETFDGAYAGNEHVIQWHFRVTFYDTGRIQILYWPKTYTSHDNRQALYPDDVPPPGDLCNYPVWGLDGMYAAGVADGNGNYVSHGKSMRDFYGNLYEYGIREGDTHRADTPIIYASEIASDHISVYGTPFDDIPPTHSHIKTQWQIFTGYWDYQYNFFVIDENNPLQDWTVSAGEVPDLTQFTFSHLDPETDYKVRVRYMCDNQTWSKWSTAKVFSTPDVNRTNATANVSATSMSWVLASLYGTSEAISNTEASMTYRFYLGDNFYMNARGSAFAYLGTRFALGDASSQARASNRGYIYSKVLMDGDVAARNESVMNTQPVIEDIAGALYASSQTDSKLGLHHYIAGDAVSNSYNVIAIHKALDGLVSANLGASLRVYEWLQYGYLNGPNPVSDSVPPIDISNSYGYAKLTDLGNENYKYEVSSTGIDTTTRYHNVRVQLKSQYNYTIRSNFDIRTDYDIQESNISDLAYNIFLRISLSFYGYQTDGYTHSIVFEKYNNSSDGEHHCRAFASRTPYQQIWSYDLINTATVGSLRIVRTYNYTPGVNDLYEFYVGNTSGYWTLFSSFLADHSLFGPEATSDLMFVSYTPSDSGPNTLVTIGSNFKLDYW